MADRVISGSGGQGGQVVEERAASRRQRRGHINAGSRNGQPRLDGQRTGKGNSKGDKGGGDIGNAMPLRRCIFKKLFKLADLWLLLVFHAYCGPNSKSIVIDGLHKFLKAVMVAFGNYERIVDWQACYIVFCKIKHDPFRYLRIFILALSPSRRPKKAADWFVHLLQCLGKLRDCHVFPERANFWIFIFI